MELHDPSKQLTSVVNLIYLRHLTSQRYLNRSLFEAWRACRKGESAGGSRGADNYQRLAVEQLSLIALVRFLAGQVRAPYVGDGSRSLEGESDLMLRVGMRQAVGIHCFHGHEGVLAFSTNCAWAVCEFWSVRATG